MVSRSRRTRSSASTPKPNQSREPQDWRGESSRPGRRSGRGRRSPAAKWLLLSLTLLVLSALVTIFCYWWWSRHRAVPLLVFTALDYDAPLPPNAWASEDAKRLSEAGSGTKWMGGTEREIRVEPLGPLAGTSSENFLAALTDGLQSAKPGGPSKNVVLLYLSAHGVLDDDGQPVLLLGKRSKSSDTTIPTATLPERVSIESLLGIVKDTDLPIPPSSCSWMPVGSTRIGSWGCCTTDSPRS
jgi:hypothetical protein